MELALRLTPPMDPDGFAFPADAEATAPRRSAPRNIPAPVAIPGRSDDLSQPSPRRQHVPQRLPMPDFVFPALPENLTSNAVPLCAGRPAGRRPRSVTDLHDKSFSYGAPPAADERPSRPNALPDFSFNPGATLQPAADHVFSPPHSSQSRAIPARPARAGHRRGGSEFVGGNLRSGDAHAILSTSPTRSENGFPQSTFTTPSLAPVIAGPPGGRRGHAHRRSAAISSHDLSDLLQPANPPAATRGSSAPASPSEIRPYSAFAFPEPKNDGGKLSDMKLPLAITDAEDNVAPAAVPPTAEPAAQPKGLLSDARATSRVRVGFSDTLEFIPRPLSLISTDTASTICPTGVSHGGGHSVQDSMSSVLSLNAACAAVVGGVGERERERERERESFTSMACITSCGTAAESRPSTAGAVLDRTQSIIAQGPDASNAWRRNSIPVLSVTPPGAERNPQHGTLAPPSPSKAPKRWSFFSLDPFNNSPGRPKGFEDAADVDPRGTSAVRPAAAKEKKGKKKKGKKSKKQSVDLADKTGKPISRKPSSKKKARSWGILSHKSKARRKSRRTPTPPPILRPYDDEDDLPECAMPSVQPTIEEAVEYLVPPTVLITPSDALMDVQNAPPSWQLPPSPSFSDDDASVTIIDLDAALGPFNTPLPRNAEWEAAQRVGGMSKRQLHSAAGMSRFTGPGMHYSHRRAESAPEMPPFNRAGLPRFSSSAAMADVFEEEEEDEEDDASSQSRKTHHGRDSGSGSATGSASSNDGKAEQKSIDIRVTTEGGEDASEDAMSYTTFSRRGSAVSGVSDDDKTQPSMGLKSEYSASSLHEDVILEEDLYGYSFEVADSGCETVAEASSETASMVNAGRLKKGKELALVDVSPRHVAATGAGLASASPFSLTASSSFPSPRSAVSAVSADTQRISTAPSSAATEDTFRSLLMGEPGPELRMSLDVPSLASSASTRDSGILFISKAGPQTPQTPQMPQSPQPQGQLASQDGERPVSFTGAVFGQRRSSLASLHRLINSSHGERSKLSVEVPIDGHVLAGEEHGHKTSRTKRISRMVQFWRTKDDTNN